MKEKTFTYKAYLELLGIRYFLGQVNFITEGNKHIKKIEVKQPFIEDDNVAQNNAYSWFVRYIDYLKSHVSDFKMGCVVEHFEFDIEFEEKEDNWLCYSLIFFPDSPLYRND